MTVELMPALVCATHLRRYHCWQTVHLAIGTARPALLCTALVLLLGTVYLLAADIGATPTTEATTGLAALTAERALLLCRAPVLARRAAVATATRACASCHRQRCGYV